jgi:hypothetical protein
MATIIEGHVASDGYDVTVTLGDGRRWVFHSAAGEPVDVQAWVDDCENELRLAEIAAADAREAEGVN